MARILGQSDFEPLVGQAFAVQNAQGPIALTLAEVSALPNSVREGGGFRLEFRGPVNSLLPQATYGFEIGGEAQDIFIVPIGPAQGQMRYEAIFF